MNPPALISNWPICWTNPMVNKNGTWQAAPMTGLCVCGKLAKAVKKYSNVSSTKVSYQYWRSNPLNRCYLLEAMIVTSPYGIGKNRRQFSESTRIQGLCSICSSSVPSSLQLEATDSWNCGKSRRLPELHWHRWSTRKEYSVITNFVLAKCSKRSLDRKCSGW